MSINFEDLKAQMRARIGQDGMPSQAMAANCESALNEFMRERRWAANKTIGSLLRSGFYAERKAHLEQLRERDRPSGYVKNRRFLLSYWHQLIRDLDHEAAAIEGTATPIQQALRVILDEGRTIKALARTAGMSEATLHRWVNGSLPRSGSEHYLMQLELVCEKPPGHLTDLLPYNHGKETVKAQPMPAIAYRERLRVQLADPYRPKEEDIPAEYRAIWQGLMQYKTSSLATLSDGGSDVGDLLSPQAVSGVESALAVDADVMAKQWGLSVEPVKPNGKDRWQDVFAGRECRSAKMCASYILGFQGWTRLPAVRGGPKKAPKAMSLGLLTDTELLFRFMIWREKRSGGINNGILAFISIARMLCDPSTGFLAKRPDIGKRLGFSAQAWTKRCAAAHVWITEARAKLRPKAKISRDPKDALEAVLSMDIPLDAFVTAANRLKSRRPANGGKREAIWGRDLLLLLLSMSNPLRLRNFQELTYWPDNTGQLRKVKGQWRIRIERQHFKNIHGAAKDKDYDQAVNEDVAPYLECYLNNYRDVLGHSPGGLVFLSSTRPAEEWASMSERYDTLTGLYVPGCPGVGEHAVRHVVGTSILLASAAEGGARDWDLAAATLHDTVETVRAHYSHISAGNDDRARQNALGSTFRKLRNKVRS